MTLKQTDLFELAAACERAGKTVTDPNQRAILTQLRDLWLNLANESPYMSDAQVAQEITALENIHAAALGLGASKAAE